MTTPGFMNKKGFINNEEGEWGGEGEEDEKERKGERKRNLLCAWRSRTRSLSRFRCAWTGPGGWTGGPRPACMFPQPWSSRTSTCATKLHHKPLCTTTPCRTRQKPRIENIYDFFLKHRISQKVMGKFRIILFWWRYGSGPGYQNFKSDSSPLSDTAKNDI